MKKGLFVVFFLLFLTGCGSEPKEERSFDTPNTEVKETNNYIRAEASVIADKVLKERYKIDNYKIHATDESFKVMQMPDDKNANSGEVYMNLYSVIGNFTYQDKIYDFTMLYSMKNESDYSVPYFYTNLDDSKTINTPLESEK